jgi:uncharacterized protein (TIGR03435 family)
MMKRSVLGACVVAVAVMIGVGFVGMRQMRQEAVRRMAALRNAAPETMEALLVGQSGIEGQEAQSGGYELVVEDGSLLKPASDVERLGNVHGWGTGPAVLQGTNMSMTELALRLSKVVGAPVVDETHLTGGYDYRLTWRPNDHAAVAEAKGRGQNDVERVPSLFKALRDQMGLRLVSREVSVVHETNRQAIGE